MHRGRSRNFEGGVSSKRRGGGGPITYSGQNFLKKRGGGVRTPWTPPPPPESWHHSYPFGLCAEPDALDYVCSIVDDLRRAVHTRLC